MKPGFPENIIRYRWHHAGIIILLLLFISLIPVCFADIPGLTKSQSLSVPMIPGSQGGLNLTPQHTDNFSTDSEALARIPVQGSLSDIDLPMYAHLLGDNGYDYVLVKASLSRLTASGLPYVILDPDTKDTTYAIASRFTNRTSHEITGKATILFDDGKNLILKTNTEASDSLLAAGLKIRWLEQVPIIINKEESVIAQEEPMISYDPRIAGMVSQVNRDFLYSTVGKLSGEEPLMVDGTNYTILTRLTDSGEPISKVTGYVYEYLHDLNMSVSYSDWDMYGYSGRNVIGTKNGTSRSDEIVLVTAHLDSMTYSGNAPGADDDASGSVAVLSFADIMNQYQFERTVRFVLFTGEEQGLLGSTICANTATGKGEKIVGVFNMDMIAWNKTGGPVMEIHTRIPSDKVGYSADMGIARTFNQSVDLYGLRSNLTPVILTDGASYSDHDSFWSRGYPAVLVIEDYYDENPYYHTEHDRRQYLDMEYYSDFAKASLATVAHLACPSDPSKESLVASCMADVTNGIPPLSVEFTDTSTGNPSHWNWSFGDGSVSHMQNPVHVYQGIGRYSVTLEISNTTEQAIVRKPQYITTHSERNSGPRGMIRISSSPSRALVFVDQVYVGNTPLLSSVIPAGDHQVRISRSGYQDWVGNVQVIQGGYTYVPQIILNQI